MGWFAFKFRPDKVAWDVPHLEDALPLGQRAKHWLAGRPTVPQYYGVVRKEPGSAFGVEFPDFPGCVSAADVFEAIVPNAVKALEPYLDEARDLPPPLPLEEVGKRYADRLAAGAFLLPVSLARREKPARPAGRLLERGVLRAIDEAATLRRLSLCLFGARDQR